MSAHPLREYLDGRPLKVRCFAEDLGLSFVTIYRWLRGERRPTWDAAKKVEDATGGAVTAQQMMDWQP